MLRLLHKLFLIFCLLFIEIVLLAIVWAIGFAGISFLQLLMSGGGLPSPQVIIPDAFAWSDENANGEYDSDEIPLENVCIWSSVNAGDYFDISNCNEAIKTSSDGKWIGEEYGGRYSSEDVYIFVLSPNGYKPTTPPVVRGTYGEFGFVSVETSLGQDYSIEEVANSYIEQDRQKHLRLTIIYSVTGLIVLSILVYIASLISEKILSLK